MIGISHLWRMYYFWLEPSGAGISCDVAVMGLKKCRKCPKILLYCTFLSRLFLGTTTITSIINTPLKPSWPVHATFLGFCFFHFYNFDAAWHIDESTMFTGYHSYLCALFCLDRSCYHDISWVAWEVSMKLSGEYSVAPTDDPIRFWRPRSRSQQAIEVVNAWTLML